MREHNQTTRLQFGGHEYPDTRAVLRYVFEALRDRGYNAVDQLVGYLISGDPTYITSYREARTLIRQIGRDRLLEELVRNWYEVSSKNRGSLHAVTRNN